METSFCSHSQRTTHSVYNLAAPPSMFLFSMDSPRSVPVAVTSNAPWLRRAGPPPCRADHSRKNGRSLMNMNHEWTQIDTKTDGTPSTTSGTKMLLQFCALGVTMSWDEGLLGARASRPHQAWHSLGHLPHLHQPGTAPWLSFGLVAAVPADRVAACSIARSSAAAKGTGCGRDARAPRPASPATRYL